MQENRDVEVDVFARLAGAARKPLSLKGSFNARGSSGLPKDSSELSANHFSGIEDVLFEDDW